ncbi:hypothetical protein GT022_11605 [Agaribacter marinus]|uniref:Uncharacterized protein n=1 Tax=Virgibacillus salarius TaxID=447199 RepID=A0A941E0G7_9BACI|nr:hypothetical protein [Virgibacillus salarius]MBR7796688.1 hypothetical protein [Virgibacillus salarius]NAZ09398.1 hypothetical protein [Agaribacter marinus]
MGEKVIYFLFTDTGTNLAKAINFFTKQSLNHVSIGFDHELTEVYSFGRKRPRNPFIGGFVKEDIRSDFMKKSDCAVYQFTVADHECEKIVKNIKDIERQQHKYRYNFIGLFGILLQIEINRKCALFCSQFVATVLRGVPSFSLKKPACFITPADIRNHEGMELIYKGKLGDYPFRNQESLSTIVVEEKTKQSFLILLSSKVKRFVIR